MKTGWKLSTELGLAAAQNGRSVYHAAMILSTSESGLGCGTFHNCSFLRGEMSDLARHISRNIQLDCTTIFSLVPRETHHRQEALPQSSGLIVAPERHRMKLTARGIWSCLKIVLVASSVAACVVHIRTLVL